MRSVSFPLASVEILASKRKEGYKEEVMRCATINGDIATLSWRDFSRIKKEYSLEASESEPELPPVKTMAKNFAKSVFQEIGSKIQRINSLSQEETERRLNICQSCDKFRPSDGRCGMCGCFMKIKTSWQSQKCPIGKW